MKIIFSTVVLSFLATSFAWAGKVQIELLGNQKHVPAECEDYCCSPNTSARMVTHYNAFNLKDNLEEVLIADPQLSSHPECKNYDTYVGGCPLSLNGKALNCVNVGPAPAILAKYMNQHSRKTFVVRKGSTVGYITDSSAVWDIMVNLYQRKPVLALIENGTVQLNGLVNLDGFLEGLGETVKSTLSKIISATLPKLYYILITGYDDDARVFTYQDSDGLQKRIALAELQKAMDWKLGEQEKELISTVTSLLGNVKLIPRFFYNLLPDHTRAQIQALSNLKDLLESEGNTFITVQ